MIHVKHTSNQAHEATRISMDVDGKFFHLNNAQVFIAHNFAEALNTSECCPELVANNTKKIAFDFTCSFQFAFCILKHLQGMIAIMKSLLTLNKQGCQLRNGVYNCQILRCEIRLDVTICDKEDSDEFAVFKNRSNQLVRRQIAKELMRTIKRKHFTSTQAIHELLTPKQAMETCTMQAIIPMAFILRGNTNNSDGDKNFGLGVNEHNCCPLAI